MRLGVTFLLFTFFALSAHYSLPSIYSILKSEDCCCEGEGRRYLNLNELLWSNNNKWLTSPALQHNETVWHNCTMLSYCTQDGPCPVTPSWHMSLAAVCKPLKHWVNRNHHHDCHENDDYNINDQVLSIHINNSFLCTWPENKKECWCWHMITSCPGGGSCVTRP